MDRQQFETWVKAIGAAWVNRDPQAAANLFTADATYQENPFEPPLQGRPAIAKYWGDVSTQTDIEFHYEILEVTAETGFAHWSVELTRIPSGKKVKLDGIFAASFHPGENRCYAFREWWARQEGPSNRRVALITGASRGLGVTLATCLAGQDYDLILTARGGEALAETAEQLRQYGTTIIPIAGDVAEPAHHRRLLETIQSLGRLDVLVNNASELGPSPLPSLADYPLTALRHVLEINVIAPLALTQMALPLLKANHGLIVNISSDAALGGYQGWGGYGASKAALDLLSRTLAHELEEAGVGVVSVDPGDMRTTMHQQAFPGEDISDRPEPNVTLPFWMWLFGQKVTDISGQRFQAQAEQWEVAR
ncbi:MAG: SDR family NAD(P)-dependent oxidoreductase [Chloroflexi bacterium]|nr:SDR family NAD(P)-dependent oxidoreductase [Chloroflexota bacterium]